MVIEDKALHPLNAFSPIVSNLLPSANVTVASSEQFQNACTPMLVTFAGMVIEDKTVHLVNAFFPIVSNLLPSANATVASFEHP